MKKCHVFTVFSISGKFLFAQVIPKAGIAVDFSEVSSSITDARALSFVVFLRDIDSS